MTTFPTRKMTRPNGGTIEVTTYSRHWAMRVLAENGELVATHSGSLTNLAHKRKMIKRYTMEKPKADRWFM